MDNLDRIIKELRAMREELSTANDIAEKKERDRQYQEFMNIMRRAPNDEQLLRMQQGKDDAEGALL